MARLCVVLHCVCVYCLFVVCYVCLSVVCLVCLCVRVCVVAMCVFCVLHVLWFESGREAFGFERCVATRGNQGRCARG